MLIRHQFPTNIDPTLRRALEIWNEELLRNFKLNDYADNAAALAAGLQVGDLYHTSGTVKVVV